MTRDCFLIGLCSLSQTNTVPGNLVPRVLSGACVRVKVDGDVRMAKARSSGEASKRYENTAVLDERRIDVVAEKGRKVRRKVRSFLFNTFR